MRCAGRLEQDAHHSDSTRDGTLLRFLRLGVAKLNFNHVSNAGGGIP